MQFSGVDASDVLDQFDFDAFLDTGENDINFDAMAYSGNFDGLEAGAGDAWKHNFLLFKILYPTYVSCSLDMQQPTVYRCSYLLYGIQLLIMVVTGVYV